MFSPATNVINQNSAVTAFRDARRGTGRDFHLPKSGRESGAGSFVIKRAASGAVHILNAEFETLTTSPTPARFCAAPMAKPSWRRNRRTRN
jgi:hypothetical protein